MLDGLFQSAPSARVRPSVSLERTQFAALPDEERRELESAAMPAYDVRSNTDVLREGDTTDQLYVMVEGWACRYKTMRDGSRQIIGLMVPGDVANLDALLFGRPGYGVRVFGAARVVAIPCDGVLALAERHGRIAKLLMRMALVENGILGQWALCLGRQSAQQRLAHLLCELDIRLADAEDGAGGFVLPLTQEQLADTLGLTPVHVNRTIQQLRALGMVVISNRTVTLPDLPALRNMAEFTPGYLHTGRAKPDRARTD